MLAGFTVNICLKSWVYFSFMVHLSLEQPPFPHPYLSKASGYWIEQWSPRRSNSLYLGKEASIITFVFLVLESCSDTPCSQIWERDLKLLCSPVCYLLLLFLTSGLGLIHKWFQGKLHGEFHTTSSSFCHV